jgi:hypothetical protein
MKDGCTGMKEDASRSAGVWAPGRGHIRCGGPSGASPAAHIRAANGASLAGGRFGRATATLPEANSPRLVVCKLACKHACKVYLRTSLQAHPGSGVWPGGPLSQGFRSAWKQDNQGRAYSPPEEKTVPSPSPF